MKRFRVFLDGLTTLAIIVASALVIRTYWPRWRVDRTPALPSQLISVEGRPRRGSGNARVAIIEYADFQCPYCGAFARNTLPSLTGHYIEAGKAFLVFKHLPLPRLHQFALGSAQAAECAGQQSKFWDMYDALFASQAHLDREGITATAEALRLDDQQFSRCIDGAPAAAIQDDVHEASVLGLTATPSFLVGMVDASARVKPISIISGSRPFADFAHAIDQALARQ
jgi:protein-disulfide isomerase